MGSSFYRLEFMFGMLIAQYKPQLPIGTKKKSQKGLLNVEIEFDQTDQTIPVPYSRSGNHTNHVFQPRAYTAMDVKNSH
jgi:hypothetical protein